MHAWIMYMSYPVMRWNMLIRGDFASHLKGHHQTTTSNHKRKKKIRLKFVFKCVCDFLFSFFLSFFFFGKLITIFKKLDHFLFNLLSSQLSSRSTRGTIVRCHMTHWCSTEYSWNQTKRPSLSESITKQQKFRDPKLQFSDIEFKEAQFNFQYTCTSTKLLILRFCLLVIDLSIVKVPETAHQLFTYEISSCFPRFSREGRPLFMCHY